MKKYLTSILLLIVSINVYAQDKPKETAKSEFILIIRSKTDLKQFSKETIQTNIKHWQAYMGSLAQNGQIAGGYRPGNDGSIISGPDKNVKNGAYKTNGEVVSSFLVINAINLDDATAIAKQCPTFELGGSVEIRPIINTAN